MNVRYLKAAQQALLRSNKRKLLLDKIELLASNPAAVANNITQLQGREERRLRVQDWRIIYVEDETGILIRDIAPRGSAYED